MSRLNGSVVRRFHRMAALGVALGLVAGVAGCASYAAPGGAADLGVMGVQPQLAADRAKQTDPSLQERFDRKPLAKFPAAIAVVRVQAPGYRSRTAASFGDGAYSVVTTRDVEKDEQFDRLAKLDMINGVAPINRWLLPSRTLHSDAELRQAAATLQEDMVLIYTLDTSFYVRDMAKPMSIVTLGLSPNQQARVTTTASAVLMDTRNGYIYGLAESSDSYSRLASAWTNGDAIDAARIRTETAAFGKLCDALEKTWGQVVTRYAKPQAANANVGG